MRLTSTEQSHQVAISKAHAYLYQPSINYHFSEKIVSHLAKYTS